jgi:c(7)-type cytochrome triheme protein
MKAAILLVAAVMLLAVSIVSARVGGGDIVFESKRIGNVVFSHETHVELMGFNCTECHPATFVTKEQHKKTAVIHKRGSQSCGACHNGKDSFDLRTNCTICHSKKEAK